MYIFVLDTYSFFIEAYCCLNIKQYMEKEQSRDDKRGTNILKNKYFLVDHFSRHKT